MVKVAKVIFALLSVLLIIALCFAGTKVLKSRRAAPAAAQSREESVLPSQQEESSAEEPPASSQDESSAAESAESSEELSEESSEKSSEESSLPPAPPMPPSEPITPPPASVAVSEYDNYFKDSLFVGHSVMVHFKGYVQNRRGTAQNPGQATLDNALFCCTSSFSLFNNLNQKPSQEDNVLPKFKGQSYRIEDLPAATGRSTVYIGLMGLNDLGMVGTPESCAREVTNELEECVRRLKEKNPDLRVTVLASTYLVRGQSFRHLNNRNISLLNSYVLEYCNRNGMDFIDVATPLTDGEGYLASVYCSDNYCHLTAAAYRVWMNVLYDYAEQKTNGTWKNPDVFKLFKG